jgi:hypothetical protein
MALLRKPQTTGLKICTSIYSVYFSRVQHTYVFLVLTSNWLLISNKVLVWVYTGFGLLVRFIQQFHYFTYFTVLKGTHSSPLILRCLHHFPDNGFDGWHRLFSEFQICPCLKLTVSHNFCPAAAFYLTHQCTNQPMNYSQSDCHQQTNFYLL